MLYPAGDKWYSCMHVPVEYFASMLREEGFDIQTDFIPFDPLTPTKYSQFLSESGNGYHFVSAMKMY